MCVGRKQVREGSPQRHRGTENGAGAVAGGMGGRTMVVSASGSSCSVSLCLCASVVKILAFDAASARSRTGWRSGRRSGPGEFLPPEMPSQVAVLSNTRQTPCSCLPTATVRPAPGGLAGLRLRRCTAGRPGGWRLGRGVPAARDPVASGGFVKCAPNPLQLSADGSRATGTGRTGGPAASSVHGRATGRLAVGPGSSGRPRYRGRWRF